MPGIGIRLYKRALAQNIKIMAYSRIWIHVVWGTKSRYPYLTDSVRPQIFNHIRNNAKEKGIFVKEINGYKEHIHCLIALSTDQTVSKIIQLLKEESSFWINQNNLVTGKFSWADEYFAVSVSESQVERVKHYIQIQPEHHQKKSWNDEVREFLQSYRFDKVRGLKP